MQRELQREIARQQSEEAAKKLAEKMDKSSLNQDDDFAVLASCICMCYTIL